MPHDTKVGIIVRDDLLNWQKLNVTAFLATGIAASAPRQIGEDYLDGLGNAYLPLTIYWATQTAGSAMQMYREDILEAMSGGWGVPSKPAKIEVPAAIAVFPYDAIFPKEWAERQGLNVRRYTVMPEGGHFAALEVPELFAKEVEDSFQQLA